MSRSRRKPKPTDLKRGDRLEVEVLDLARGGAGVAREPSGMVIFIPYVLPGDRVLVEVVEARRRFLRGRLIEVLEPSPERVEPRCPAFGTCGGCDWQHVPYAQQFERKRKGLEEALARVGIEVEVEVQLFPAQETYGYRNRVQIKGRGDELGFFAPGSHRLIPIQECPIARPEINAKLAEVRRLGERMGGTYRVELEVEREGRVQVRWGGTAGGGFRQVHDQQNEVLRTWVREALQEPAVLWDLYGGRGNLSDLFRGTTPEIHCVDPSAPAKEARRGRTYHRMATLPWLRKQDPLPRREGVAAILDPPRIGLGHQGQEVVQHLTQRGVESVVHIGCDPDAFAKDLCLYLQKGWEIVRFGLLDLFPQTHHVESMVLLRGPGEPTDETGS